MNFVINKSKIYKFSIYIFLLLIFIVIISCEPPNNKNTDRLFNTLNKNKSFPNLTVKSLEGDLVDITAYTNSDKIKLICFWATWCGPCSLEFNEFKQHYKKWQEQYNFELIGISIDESKMYSNLSDYIVRKQWPFLFFYDENKKLSDTLNIKNIPRSYLFDQQGNLVHINYSYYEGITKEIEAMLIQLQNPK